MIICIDGNDGTGKSTLISKLKEIMPQHEYQDRGLPSGITICEEAEPADEYFILSCPVEVSIQRLTLAGRDMTEHWHLPETLAKYHEMFLALSFSNGWHLLDSTQETEVLAKIVFDTIQSKL
jgi:thymidylate kinase